MITRLDETEKRNILDIQDIYKNCKYVVAITSVMDDDGLLIAVSDNLNDYDELSKLVWSLNDTDKTMYYVMCGSYNEDALNLQYELKGN